MSKKSFFFFCLILLPAGTLSLSALEIHDSPLVASFRPPPANLIFLLDDSETMAREIHPENHAEDYKTASLEPFFHIFDVNSDLCMHNSEKLHWKTRSSAFNSLYYNPLLLYRPWPAATFCPDLGDASLLLPRISPLDDKTFAMLEPFMYLSPKEDFPCLVQDDEVAELEGSGWEKMKDPAAFRKALHLTRAPDARAIFSFELSATGEKTILLSWPLFGKDSPFTGGKADIRVLDHGKREIANLVVEQGKTGEKNFSVHIGELNPLGPDLFLELRPGARGEKSLLLVDKVRIEEDMSIPNAHYFIPGGSENGKTGHFLVSFGMNDGKVMRKIYETFCENTLEPGLVRGISPARLPDPLKALLDPANPSFIDPEKDLQNFTNWFQYYRNSFLVMQSGLVHLSEDFSHVYPGFITLSGKQAQPVISLPPSSAEARNAFLESLYRVQVDRNFSRQEKDIARGLETIGQYFATDLVPEGVDAFSQSPYLSEKNGGACQHAFVLLLTDGLDGRNDFPESIVAIAETFYERDLAPGLPDLLPPTRSDTAAHQHMVTSVLHFKDPETPEENPGNGGRDPLDLPLSLVASAGKGLYRAGNGMETLSEAMRDILFALETRAGSGISGQGTARSVSNGKDFYHTTFNPFHWSGNLQAFSFPRGTNTISLTEPLWNAAQKLSAKDPSRRIILSALGSETFAFREESIPQSLKKDLVPVTDFPSSHGIRDLVAHIRGEKVEGLRKRPLDGETGAMYENRLGDIVNSTPVYHRNILYVGANDGMLHAFDSKTGEEIFAFVPSFVYPDLRYLAREDYTDHHRYFVDGPLTIQTLFHDGKSRELLVGGLGKGGKGYYALQSENTSRRDPERSATESDLLSGLETWEFPPPSGRLSEKDMGFSYSDVAIVRSNATDHPWIAVFGNGYQSVSGEAVLFVLDAFTGEEIRRIHTHVMGNNGLSSPALVDTNKDGKADFVYAGDLRGNLWKFNISSQNPEDWDVFLRDGSTGKPLFTGTDSGGRSQPVTGKPAIAKHCSGTGFMVLWGTGKYLGLPDLEDFGTQTFYGIWDYGGEKASLGSLGRRENSGHLYPLESEGPGPSLFLVRQTIVAANFSMEDALQGEVGEDIFYPVASHSKHPQTYAWEEKGKSLAAGSTAGWFFDFPERGERMTEDARVYGSAIIGASFVPTCITSPCTAGGYSWINALDLCSGSRMPDTFFDINADQALQGAYKNDENRDSGDSLIAHGVAYEVSRLRSPVAAFLMGILAGYGPECILLPDLHGERMLPLSFSGTREGIFYWRVR